jgi:Rrf2 family protein
VKKKERIIMQLNVSTCYAMQIMLVLARSNQRKSKFTSVELADELKISKRYVIHIVRKLRNSGLLQSYNGADGGYALTKDASEISLYDIISRTEGTVGIPECITAKRNHSLYSALNIAQTYLITYLKTLTLDELIDGDVNENLIGILKQVREHIGDIRVFSHSHGQ